MTDQVSSERLVHEFGKAWDRCDIEGVLAMMAPDVVYQNVPIPEMRGHDAVRTFITPNMKAAQRMDWVFLHTVSNADGSKVMTERVDSFIFDEGTVACPVMGIFEIEDGLIKKWRDYADIGSFVRDMTAIGRGPGPGIKA